MGRDGLGGQLGLFGRRRRAGDELVGGLGHVMVVVSAGHGHAAVRQIVHGLVRFAAH